MYISKREFLELLKCWQNMPKGISHTPAKSAFTPSSISKLLPHVFLMKLTREGEFQLRLIGTELEDMLGGTEASRLRFQQMARDESDFFWSICESKYEAAHWGAGLARNYAWGKKAISSLKPLLCRLQISRVCRAMCWALFLLSATF